jgi:3-oxoacyl-[acyl-carrier protein] reductase
MRISLDGRSALVTGGSLGLGRAVAKEFCTAGANVPIVARGQQMLDEAAAAIGASGKGRVVTVAADVGTAAG